MRYLDKFLSRKFSIDRICGRILSIAFSCTLLILPACKKPQPNSHRGDASELYRKSVRLLKLYTDSIMVAPDSATLNGLEERFSDALTDLNFSYPSETCLDISEGENDTLTYMTERFISIRDSLLHRYANPIEQTDSIISDSIKVN